MFVDKHLTTEPRYAPQSPEQRMEMGLTGWGGPYLLPEAEAGVKGTASG